jgi:hypothetical protein
MSTGVVRTLGVIVFGTVYWYLVARSAGVAEPWDAHRYWHIWYPVSLVLSALTGIWLKPHGWRGGAIMTFTQLPVMWLGTGIGALAAAGLLILCALAVPAIAISMLAARIAARPRAA